MLEVRRKPKLEFAVMRLRHTTRTADFKLPLSFWEASHGVGKGRHNLQRQAKHAGAQVGTSGASCGESTGECTEASK